MLAQWTHSGFRGCNPFTARHLLKHKAGVLSQSEDRQEEVFGHARAGLASSNGYWPLKKQIRRALRRKASSFIRGSVGIRKAGHSSSFGSWKAKSGWNAAEWSAGSSSHSLQGKV